MSVARLKEKFNIISVADEIESFFNVLLHQCVKRVPHNFEHSMYEVMQYFLGS